VYVASFLLYGLAESVAWIFAAVFLYGIGEAFRSGTHKAMIFAWLVREGRESERVEVYGRTRSWSKFGSAASVIVAAGLVLATDRYAPVFLFSTVPYLLAIGNFLGYPKELDVSPEETTARERSSTAEVARRLWAGLVESFRRRGLRRLILESMGFEGTFHATKDYLQPALVGAVAGGMARDASPAGRAVLLIAAVYFVLYLAAGVASREAKRIPDRFGGEARAARVLWISAAALFTGILAFGWFDLAPLLIAAFVLLHVLQNLWRPVLISRFHAFGEESRMATVLSVESLAKRIGIMILAPVAGIAIDNAGSLWPIGALGAAICVVSLISGRTAR
jgi:MFS family permease